MYFKVAADTQIPEMWKERSIQEWTNGKCEYHWYVKNKPVILIHSEWHQHLTIHNVYHKYVVTNTWSLYWILLIVSIFFYLIGISLALIEAIFTVMFKFSIFNESKNKRFSYCFNEEFFKYISTLVLITKDIENKKKPKKVCTIQMDRRAHTMYFVTPVIEHWLEWGITQWVHHDGLNWHPITPWMDVLPWSYILLPYLKKTPSYQYSFNYRYNTLILVTLTVELRNPKPTKGQHVIIHLSGKYYPY